MGENPPPVPCSSSGRPHRHVAEGWRCTEGPRRALRGQPTASRTPCSLPSLPLRNGLHVPQGEGITYVSYNALQWQPAAVPSPRVAVPELQEKGDGGGVTSWPSSSHPVGPGHCWGWSSDPTQGRSTSAHRSQGKKSPWCLTCQAGHGHPHRPIRRPRGWEMRRGSRRGSRCHRPGVLCDFSLHLPCPRCSSPPRGRRPAAAVPAAGRSARTA